MLACIDRFLSLPIPTQPSKLRPLLYRATPFISKVAGQAEAARGGFEAGASRLKFE